MTFQKFSLTCKRKSWLFYWHDQQFLEFPICPDSPPTLRSHLEPSVTSSAHPALEMGWLLPLQSWSRGCRCFMQKLPPHCSQTTFIISFLLQPGFKHLFVKIWVREDRKLAMMTKLKHKCSNSFIAKMKQSKFLLSEGPTSPPLGRQLRHQQQFSYLLLLLCWIVFAVLIYVGSNHNIWDFSLLHWDRCVTEGTHWDLHILRTHNTNQHHRIKELFRLK